MLLQSLLSYFTIIVILVLLAKEASKHVRINMLKGHPPKYMHIYMWVAFICFAFFLGVRYDVGVDHLFYLDRYLTGTGLTYAKYEIGFKAILQVCTWLNLHAVYFFSILAFIQISFFFNAFKADYFIYPLLFLFLFLDGEIGSWMNIIRSAMAMCIWCSAIKFAIEKKWCMYFGFCVLAVCIHRSAIILMPIYFLIKDGKDYFSSTILQYIILSICLVIRYGFGNFILQAEGMVMMYQQILGGDADIYSNYVVSNIIDEKAVVGSGIAFYVKTIVWVLIIFISPQMKKFYNNTFFITLYNIFFLGLAISYIFPTGTISLSRPFRYFFSFQTVMIAYSVYYLLKTKKEFYGVLLIILFVGIFIMMQVTASPDSHKLYQYYFQHNMNYYPN